MIKLLVAVLAGAGAYYLVSQLNLTKATLTTIVAVAAFLLVYR